MSFVSESSVSLPVAEQSPRGLLLAALCVQTFAAWVVIDLPNSFLPRYATAVKGLSVSEIGYVYAANPLCSLLATLWFGALCMCRHCYIARA